MWFWEFYLEFNTLAFRTSYLYNLISPFTLRLEYVFLFAAKDVSKTDAYYFSLTNESILRTN